MPIGGATILWNENSPADADNAGAGAGVIRSIETSVRIGVGAEHLWASSGGAGTGYHLFGSARPYYDVQSNVSSSGSDGRLMHCSDTSRLFAVGSGGTVYLGGPKDIEHTAFPGTVPQTVHWVEDSGSAFIANPDTNFTVNFITTFNGIPYTQVSVQTDLTTAGRAYTAHIRGLGTGSFTIIPMLITASSVGTASNVTVSWRSIGTITHGALT